VVGLTVCGLAAACGTQRTSSRPAVFWTQSPHGGADERGGVGRADLTGSHADGRFIAGAKAPAGIALSGRYVYWANYGSGTIARASLDGSDVKERFIEGEVYAIVGIAVDGGHIYWTNSGLDPGSGTIGRANLDGSGVDEDFIKAGDSPIGLAVDSRHVYWTHRYWNRGITVSGYAIGRANLDGSGVDLRFIDASNRLDGVAVNDRYVFWSNIAEHAIGRANLDGAHVSQRCITTETVPLESVPEGLAADTRHVYWTSYPADAIGRANLDGSAVDERFIAVDGVPEGIAVTASGRAASPPSGAGRCRTSKPPLLLGPTGQSAGFYASGWGEVAPAVISNGGVSASGMISNVHWTRWGGKVAVGRGLHPTFAPGGGYYRRPAVIELRASAIRRCKPGGRLVYTRFTTRQQVRPGGPMGKWFAWAQNMCTGFR
jgi:sugar lactone lactonase YvrE